MTKKQRARQILDLLAEEYPLADCTLQYDEAWKLLVSVRLAAQCTDARVNIVTKDLFQKYTFIDFKKIKCRRIWAYCFMNAIFPHQLHF